MILTRHLACFGLLFVLGACSSSTEPLSRKVTLTTGKTAYAPSNPFDVRQVE